MLRVWSVSGQELAAVPTGDAFEDVRGLKRHLRSQHGFPVCLQQLLQAGRCLGDLDPLAGPADLNLVLLSALGAEQMPQAKSELLEYVVDASHVEVGRALLAAGVDKNIVEDEYGETALICASSKGCVEIVLLLLDADADKNARNVWGVSALMQASLEGHVEIARLLLDAGANANLQDREGWTALMHASCTGRVEIARLLLDAGANKDLWNFGRETPLMRAASTGHVETVRLLLDAGADKNLRDRYDQTALMQAFAEGHDEIVGLLLDAGSEKDLHECVYGPLSRTRLLRERSAKHESLTPEAPCPRTAPNKFTPCRPSTPNPHTSTSPSKNSLQTSSTPLT